ncbi:BA3454 family stress response protein [Bacillus cereus]|nr:BA3454 family stress response protein [Bacillus cereus]
MMAVTITVNIQGKNYQTNVIAYAGMTKEAIEHLAEVQVRKQWSL